jgi:hypothetical protein
VKTAPKLSERFWARVRKGGRIREYVGTRCWEWTGSRNVNGYGNMVVYGSESWDGNKRVVLAHRVAWRLAAGEWLASDVFVCHKCDNPRCVRPDHLFQGSAADNIDDMRRKGRSGWQTNPAKCLGNRLSAKQARKIFELGQPGVIGPGLGRFGSHELAKKYRVSRSAITAIWRGKTYWWATGQKKWQPVSDFYCIDKRGE